MSGECDKCSEHCLDCKCTSNISINDIGHHCQKGTFTCFRMRGDKNLTLDAPKNAQIEVSVCPFCGHHVR